MTTSGRMNKWIAICGRMNEWLSVAEWNEWIATCGEKQWMECYLWKNKINDWINEWLPMEE